MAKVVAKKRAPVVKIKRVAKKRTQGTRQPAAPLAPPAPVAARARVVQPSVKVTDYDTDTDADDVAPESYDSVRQQKDISSYD